MKEQIKWNKDVKDLPDQMCEQEAEWVGPGKTKHMFHCKKCDLNLTKTNGPRHMLTIHEIDCRNWILYKDYLLLRHGWSRTHLERYFANATGSEKSPRKSASHMDVDEGNASGSKGQGTGQKMMPLDATEPRLEMELSQTDNLMAVANMRYGDARRLERNLTRAETPPPPGAVPKSMAFPPQSIAPLTQSSSKAAMPSHCGEHRAASDIAASSQSGSDATADPIMNMMNMFMTALPQLAARHACQTNPTEPAAPEMAVRDCAKEWSHKNWQSGCRWPFDAKGDRQRKFPEFDRYMKLRNKDIETIKVYNQGLNYFFSIIEIGDDFSPVAFMASLYESGLVEIAFSLDILSPMYSWTRKIVQALSHWAKSLVITCTAKSYANAERLIKLLLSNWIEPTLIQCKVEKEASCHKKRVKDEDALDNLPPIEAMTAAISEAMLDIKAISAALHEGRDGSEFGVNFYWAATVALVGLWYTSSPVGRPGEIERIQLEAVKELIVKEKHRDVDDKCPIYIVCDKHKTSKKYGERGIYIPAGVFQAMVHYAYLPGRREGYFLMPARLSTEIASIHKTFNAYCRQYTPTYGKNCATLMRKYMATEVAEDDDHEKSKTIAASLNAQSKAVSRKVYALRKARIDAKKGKAMTEAIYGSEVEWPEAWQASGEDYETRLQRIGKMYKRKSLGGKDSSEPSPSKGTDDAAASADSPNVEVDKDAEKTDPDEDDENHEGSESESEDVDIKHDPAAHIAGGTSHEDAFSSELREVSPEYAQEILKKLLEKHGVKAAAKLAEVSADGDFIVKGGQDFHRIPQSVVQGVLDEWNSRSHCSDGKIRFPPRKAPPRESKASRPAAKGMPHPVKAFFSQSFSKAPSLVASVDVTPAKASKGKGGQKAKGAANPGKGESQKEQLHAVSDDAPLTALVGKGKGKGKSKKKGRQSELTSAEEQWVVAERNRWTGRTGPSPVPNLVLRELLAEGIKKEVLRPSVTSEQMRHVCRTFD